MCWKNASLQSSNSSKGRKTRAKTRVYSFMLECMKNGIKREFGLTVWMQQLHSAVCCTVVEITNKGIIKCFGYCLYASRVTILLPLQQFCTGPVRQTRYYYLTPGDWYLQTAVHEWIEVNYVTQLFQYQRFKLRLWVPLSLFWLRQSSSLLGSSTMSLIHFCNKNILHSLSQLKINHRRLITSLPLPNQHHMALLHFRRPHKLSYCIRRLRLQLLGSEIRLHLILFGEKCQTSKRREVCEHAWRFGHDWISFIHLVSLVVLNDLVQQHMQIHSDQTHIMLTAKASGG